MPNATIVEVRATRNFYNAIRRRYEEVHLL